MSQLRSTTGRQSTQQPASGLLNQRNVVIAFVVLCLIALLVFTQRRGGKPSNALSDGADVTNAQAVAQGRQLYTTRCAGCHGADLGGEPGWPQRRANGVMPASPLDQRGHVWQRDDRWIFTTIKHGGQATAAPGTISAMPALGGGLTDAEIWAVISYIKSTWPANIQQAQPTE